MELKNENDRLADDLKAAREEIFSLTEQTDIAFEDCEIKIEFHYENQNRKRHGSKYVSLRNIFEVMSVEMLDVSVSELRIKDVLKSKFLPDSYERDFDDSQFIKKLLNQYRALELIYSSWSDDSKVLYWGLTKKGRKVRDDLILIRNK